MSTQNLCLLQSAYVEQALRPGVRVTLELGAERSLVRLEKGPLGQRRQEALAGSVVLPSEPRARAGTYWGYSVRIARGLAEALSACPYQVKGLALPFIWYCVLLHHNEWPSTLYSLW
jgi:predicted SPOUT superfamily RNA methylase MTH1